MRTAGMVMGIVGGALALLLAILFIFGGIAFMNFSLWDSTYNNGFDSDKWESMVNDLSHVNVLEDNDFDDYDFEDFDFDDFDSDDFYYESLNMGQTIAGTMFLVAGICGAVAGVMGLVGGLIVKKKNVAAGVLMIIAAALSLFSFFNIISMALFILGAVFTLMRDRQNQVYAPAYPMPPNYAYPPYPPQQQYPQQSSPSENPSQNPPENPQQ